MNQQTVDSQMLYRAQESMAKWFSSLFSSKDEATATKQEQTNEKKDADKQGADDNDFFYNAAQALRNLTKNSNFRFAMR